MQKVPQKAVAKAKLLIESRQQKRVLNIGGAAATRSKQPTPSPCASHPHAPSPPPPPLPLAQVMLFKPKLTNQSPTKNQAPLRSRFARLLLLLLLLLLPLEPKRWKTRR